MLKYAQDWEFTRYNTPGYEPLTFTFENFYRVFKPCFTPVQLKLVCREIQMRQAKSCNNCARGLKMSINKDILCRVKGVVSRDFTCSKHLRMPDAWIHSERKPKCIECEFFTPPEDESEHDPSVGYCQLFTVRYFNGEIKSACSKFCRKPERIIS